MELLKDDFNDVFGEVGTRHIIFSKGFPDFDAFIRASDVGIRLSFDFAEDSGMDGVEGVEGFGVELYG